MSIPKLDSSTELIISQRMAAELEDYLKSDVLYWHVSEPNPLGSHMPQLTIGALLEALTWAEASRSDLLPDQQAELIGARQQLDRIHAAHPALFVDKASRELQSRLTAYRANLADAQRKTRGLYTQDARVRAKIYLLEQALGSDVTPEFLQQCEQIDQELYKLFVPGEFIWDPRLQTVFPKKTCWWLYGHLLEDHYS
jgi:hypothetical protein